MNVKVRHRLSRGFSNVDPDVEAVGKVFGRDGLAGDGKGGEKVGLLVARRVEPCRDVSFSDDEGVAVADGEGVPESEHALAPVEDALGVRGAEGGRRARSSFASRNREDAVEPGVDAGSAAPAAHRSSGNVSALAHRTSMDVVPEPPRVSRRLQLLRGWSHDKTKQVFTGDERAGACAVCCW